MNPRHRQPIATNRVNHRVVTCDGECDGAHWCLVCNRRVHVICGEHDPEAEGFGQPVTCRNCIAALRKSKRGEPCACVLPRNLAVILSLINESGVVLRYGQ
jgi:hypothetical protein